MGAPPRSQSVVKGIIHCHSDLSYDCNMSLERLCTHLRQEGFSFVALTEHAKGVSEEDYQRYVSQCQSESNDSFVVVPGLEIRFDDGNEVAAIGVTKFVNGNVPCEVVSKIREQQGYSVWVHPLKRGRKLERFLDSDAVEVLNGKVDGTLCPNPFLLGCVRKENQDGRGRHAIFGLDLHDLEQSLDVWIECEVSALTARDVVDSLRNGTFVSCVANGTVPSSGELGIIADFRFKLLRIAWRMWNSLRRFAPLSLRGHLIRMSRPVVGRIKRGRRNHQSSALANTEHPSIGRAEGSLAKGRIGDKRKS
ncbi:MAG TPA: PHP domain-containing protein [Terriglobia bacterium]|nr:PHP domain-containing protein [Terriglobia bacterium]